MGASTRKRGSHLQKQSCSSVLPCIARQLVCIKLEPTRSFKSNSTNITTPLSTHGCLLACSDFTWMKKHGRRKGKHTCPKKCSQPGPPPEVRTSLFEAISLSAFHISTRPRRRQPPLPSSAPPRFNFDGKKPKGARVVGGPHHRSMVMCVLLWSFLLDPHAKELPVPIVIEDVASHVDAMLSACIPGDGESRSSRRGLAQVKREFAVRPTTAIVLFHFMHCLCSSSHCTCYVQLHYVSCCVSLGTLMTS